MLSDNVAQMYLNENGLFQPVKLLSPHRVDETGFEILPEFFYRERKGYLCRPNIPP